MHILTSLLLLAIACYGVLAQDQGDAKTIMRDCMQEHGVDPKEMEGFKSGALKAADAKDNMKCATQCIMVKMGILDGSGKLVQDGLRKRYVEKGVPENVDKVMASCQDLKGSNPCDTAFQVGTCMHNMKMDI